MTAPGDPATTAPDASAIAVLAAYERVRDALAADDGSAAATAARDVDSAAKAAATKATPTATPHFNEIATHGAALAAAKDIEAARVAFGEVSRHVIALLATEPSLAQGKHVFECPMAKGYKKWVQTSDNLENPYMGKRMLACGGASTWD